MELLVDLLEARVVHVCIDLGRGDTGVAEHLLDHLGVFTTGEHKRREAVAQSMKRNVRESRTTKQRLERSAEDVVTVEGCAYQRGEYEAIILPEPVVL